MAVFDVTEALSYLGKTITVDLTVSYPDEPVETCSYVVHVLGVVLALKGVYEFPHFLCVNALNPRPFPDEMFWDDITRITVIDHPLVPIPRLERRVKQP